MNQYFNFNPDEKRMALAQMLQQGNMSQSQGYKGPMSSSTDPYAGVTGALTKLYMNNKKANAPSSYFSQPAAPVAPDNYSQQYSGQGSYGASPAASPFPSSEF
jgi:hypothetical protein